MNTLFLSIRTSQILIDSNAGDMNELMIFLGTESGNVLRVKPRKVNLNCYYFSRYELSNQFFNRIKKRC